MISFKWPVQYTFGSPLSTPHRWFAWFPVRTWDYRFVWLKTVYRVRIVKKPWLDGPDWSFWSYDLGDDNE